MRFFVHIWVPVLSLAVSILALLVVMRYTRITAAIERAAQAQAEGLEKPVVVLQFVTRGDDREQAFEKIEMGISPQAMRLALSPEGKFVIKNIGSGPALNVDYVLHLATESSLRDPHSHPRKLPYLAALDSMPGPVTSASLGLNLYTFEAMYRSLSGKLYRTEMKISAGILQEEWIFQEVVAPEKWWSFFL